MNNIFFACFSRLRWIKRWGLKRNFSEENVLEHSAEVAHIAHALAVLRNRYYGGNVDAAFVALLGLYHDYEESVTTDFCSLAKNFSPEVKSAFDDIATAARHNMLSGLPKELRAEFSGLLFQKSDYPEESELVKAADIITAWLKCVSEVASGNKEFVRALEDTKARLDGLDMPEVSHFMEVFAPAYTATVDDLLAPHGGDV